MTSDTIVTTHNASNIVTGVSGGVTFTPGQAADDCVIVSGAFSTTYNNDFNATGGSVTEPVPSPLTVAGSTLLANGQTLPQIRTFVFELDQSDLARLRAEWDAMYPSIPVAPREADDD